MKSKGLTTRPEIIKDLIQWRYDGKTYLQIIELLKEKHDLTVAMPTVNRALKYIRENANNLNIEVSKTEEDSKLDKPAEVKNPQDILYENRNKVIQMKRERYINYSIAKEFGVKEEDVVEFLSKRKSISPDEKREIIYMGATGKSAQYIADYYQVNVKTIEKILENSGKITTSPKVMAKVIKENDDENIENMRYNPQIVKDFINFMKVLRYRYNFCNENIERFDNVRNDIYHKLELEQLDQEEQLELLDKIKKTSIERREMKDFIEIVQPLIEFIDIPQNKKCIDSLSNIAGMMCNKAKKMETRVYFMRENEDE